MIKILDGAMGTQLQQMGLKPGGIPEMLNLTEPDKIIAIHRAYIEAGAQVIYTNTFGANRYKVRRSGHSVQELIGAAVKNAKEALLQSGAGEDVKVALDLGPIGALIAPLGDLTFEEAYDIFAEQVRAGQDADWIVLETMTDLYETKAAVLAARENSDKPVYVTMTFEPNGRTFTGTSIASMALTLEGLGVDGIGFNCSLGPLELAPMVKELYTRTKLPIFFKPNAGLPDPLTGQYNVDAKEFAEMIATLLPYGLAAVGGCCGTTPEYIRALSQAVRKFESEGAHLEKEKEKEYEELTKKREACPLGVCCASQAVFLDRPRVIGERLNPTGKKRFQQALREQDMDYILQQALSQVEAGADILDVNVGYPGIDEKEMMCRVIRALQAVVDVPLQIDSNDPQVLAAALRIYNGKPIVNSVNGEEKSLASILPLVKRYGAAVVGLTLDENGIAAKAEERFAVAKKIADRAALCGIDKKNLLIDCLTLTASAEQEAVAQTLRAVQLVRDRLGLPGVLGVSNISFGLPYRELVNTTFLTMALQNGLMLPILNPNSEAMMGVMRAYRLLMNYDKNAVEYTDAYKNYVPAAKAEAAPLAAAQKPSGEDAAAKKIGLELSEEAMQLYYAVVRGLASEGERLARQLLETLAPMTIVNQILIPALDTVGDGFEKGTIYLPQLILSASVVQGAFARIKEYLAGSGAAAESKGKVVLATVKGDIHDIGKNIVKVLLENYGFTVIDLGRDVEIEAVVLAAQKHEVKLIGLSALMTTTLGSMEQTIAAVRNAGLDCRIVVGGAVLTQEYADRIGADFYAKDAKETVDIARKVYGVS